jgi:Ca2+-binding EF-hand superfamily protein
MSMLDTMTDKDAERLYDAFQRLAWSANVLDIEDLAEIFRSELKQESEPQNKEKSK